MVNDSVVQNGNMHLPFGGVGGSGYGRYHGVWGFQNFSNQKSLMHAKATAMYPNEVRFPPYTDSKENTLNTLMKYGDITYGQVGKCCMVFWLVAVLLAVGIAMAVMYA